MKEKHFFATHTFVSDEARKEYLTPPEKIINEKKWAEDAIGEYARCMQTWCGNDEFLYCHWIAKSEQDVYRQLEEWNFEGRIVNTMVQEIHQFMSGYRKSEEILMSYPEDGMYW